MISLRRLSLAALCAGALATAAAAQDQLGEVRRLYDSASYAEALAALTKVESTVDLSVDPIEVEQYRVLCMLALGRPADAEQALDRLVMARPLYIPDAARTSPRLVSLHRKVRGRVLPTLARQAYEHARGSFDKNDMAEASRQFKQVLALTEAPPPEHVPLMTELRVLATGFLKLAEPEPTPPPVVLPPPETPVATLPGVAPLTETSLPAAVSPAPASASAFSAEPPAPEATDGVYDAANASAQPPVPIEKPIPAWDRPASLRAFAFEGLLELVVDSTGAVSRAAMLKPIHPTYDFVLVNAAKRWRFRPATLVGNPVTYRLLVSVVVPRRTTLR